MQQIDWNNETMELIDHPTQEQIDDALSDPRTKAVSLHKEGSVVFLHDKPYEVQGNGSWKEIPEFQALLKDSGLL